MKFNMKKTKPSDKQMCYTKIYIFIVLNIFVYLSIYLSICLSGFTTTVAVFRKPNTIPLCFSTDLFLNFLLSWLLVLLLSTFFLDVLFSFSLVVSIP